MNSADEIAAGKRATDGGCGANGADAAGGKGGARAWGVSIGEAPRPERVVDEDDCR
jgi:hypothetical protein